MNIKEVESLEERLKMNLRDHLKFQHNRTLISGTLDVLANIHMALHGPSASANHKH